MDKDPRKVTTPKAENLFSHPNELDKSLEDLNAYEYYINTDNVFQSTDGDRLKVEKYEPYEDAKKAKVDKKASKESLEKQHEHRDIFDEKNVEKGLLNDPKEIDELLESEEAYKKHLGIE
jgi:hypothetical protein